MIDLGEKWPQPVLAQGEPTLLIGSVAPAQSGVRWRAACRALVKPS
jgi:hypothetical protein